MCPTRTIAQFVSSATLDSFDSVSRIFTALVIFPLCPINACIGSSTTIFAPIWLIAFFMRSSSSVNSPLSSFINATLLQSAPACSSLGFIVSPFPSSEHWYITISGFFIFWPSGKYPPFVNIAAIWIINVDFPSPGSPCNIVIFPQGIYGYHIHSTSVVFTLE